MKEASRFRGNTEDADEVISPWFLGLHAIARCLNSAEGGTLFFRFLFLTWKAIAPHTMSSKAIPATPIAIAVTFKDLRGLVASGTVDVSDGGLAAIGKGEDEKDESGTERVVGD